MSKLYSLNIILDYSSNVTSDDAARARDVTRYRSQAAVCASPPVTSPREDCHRFIVPHVAARVAGGRDAAVALHI